MIHCVHKENVAEAEGTKRLEAFDRCERAGQMRWRGFIHITMK
jgi:hypothetical protein